MRKVLTIILIVALLTTPVSALEFQAPTAPDSGEKYMPPETESFADGVAYILKKAVAEIQPSLTEASGICLSLIVIALLISLLNSFSSQTKRITELVGVLMIGVLLIEPSNTLVKLGTQTISQISEYGKLLLPVMTAAVAAQGGVTMSTALYAGTLLFDNVLSVLITKLLVPMIYIYIALAIANSALDEGLLKKLMELVKWLMTWSLKIALYIFTGYISMTGVIHGTADAAAIKATKLAISGAVPVVGGILSDASETILVSAGVLKNSVGIYGLLAILAVWIGPFIKVGIEYLLLKATSAICHVLGDKQSSGLIGAFSNAMGIILAAIGTICLLMLISVVCFMKGVS